MQVELDRNKEKNMMKKSTVRETKQSTSQTDVEWPRLRECVLLSDTIARGLFNNRTIRRLVEK